MAVMTLSTHFARCKYKDSPHSGSLYCPILLKRACYCHTLFTKALAASLFVSGSDLEKIKSKLVPVRLN